jgi:putative SOS response-associated peptidase YedK
VRLSDAGERVFEDLRWGFKLPDRLLFNTRSDNVLTSKFWKERFIEHRCIVPASAFIEWQDVPKGQPVILEPRDYEEWLTPTERPPVHLLRITPDEQMDIERVDAPPVADTLPAAQQGQVG